MVTVFFVAAVKTKLFMLNFKSTLSVLAHYIWMYKLVHAFHTKPYYFVRTTCDWTWPLIVCVCSKSRRRVLRRYNIRFLAVSRKVVPVS